MLRTSTTRSTLTRTLGAAAAVLAVLTVVACTSEPTAEADGFEFSYEDASIAPEYHRSWTVTVGPDGTGTYTVGSYQEELASGEVSVSPETLDEMLTTAPDAGFEADEACTGGTGRILKLTSGDTVVSTVKVEVCDGGEEEAAALDTWISPVRSQIEIPD